MLIVIVVIKLHQRRWRRLFLTSSFSRKSVVSGEQRQRKIKILAITTMGMTVIQMPKPLIRLSCGITSFHLSSRLRSKPSQGRRSSEASRIPPIPWHWRLIWRHADPSPWENGRPFWGFLARCHRLTNWRMVRQILSLFWNGGILSFWMERI